MAENNGEKLTGSQAELNNEKLSALKGEKNTAKATESEIKQARVELEQGGERAEARLAKEAEKEVTEPKLAKKLETEKNKETAEKKKEAKVEKHQPHVASTPKERNRVYKREIKKVQSQLPPSARTFSKVVHNRAVEAVSDVAEKTVLRPSVLIGGSVVGLLLGGLVYFAARYYGYPIPAWSLMMFLVVGGVLGIVIEFVLKATPSGKKS